MKKKITVTGAFFLIFSVSISSSETPPLENTLETEAVASTYASAIEFPPLSPALTNAPPQMPLSGEERPLRTQKSAMPVRMLNAQAEKRHDDILPVIPGFDHELTKHWIKRYSSKGNLEWIRSSLKRGEPYLAFIRGEVESRHLPPELVYLPLIESGFLITARSPSGASGLWQFMRNSMHPYMKMDEWRDERFDFWKSTQGALSKLQVHFKEFGNWPLALAAYNSGAGAIGRLVKTHGTTDYWYFVDKKLLKVESTHYVSKLLAVYYIISNPRQFKLDICTPPENYEWTRIDINKQVNLATLAGYAQIDLPLLRNANRELLSMVTPPGIYQLKVRREDAAAVEQALSREDITLLKYTFYTIKTGDTLFALALSYGVSIEQLLTQNPGLNPQLLKPGQQIMIPAFRDAVPVPAAAAHQRDGKSAAWQGKWVVQKGDTLWSIARNQRVSVEELARANGISVRGTLSIGKVLRVPFSP